MTVLRSLAALVLLIDLLIVAAVLFVSPPSQLLNNAVEIWVDRTDPTLETHQQEQALFGNDTWISVHVWAQDEAAAEAASRTLTRAFQRLDAVSSVLSPHALAVLQSDEEGLFFDVLSEDVPWAERHAQLSAHPLAADLLARADMPTHAGFLLEEFTASASSGDERQALLREIRALIAAQDGVVDSAVTGTAVMNAELNRLSWRDITVLTPVTVLAVLIVAGAVFWRTFPAVAAIASVSGLAIASTLSLMLAVGVPFNMLTIALPGVLFVLGTAAGLHVFQFMVRASGALPAVVQDMARPLALSHVTTAFGFLLMGLIAVPPVQMMAVWGATGIAWSGVHVAIVLPLALNALRSRSTLPQFGADRWSATLVAMMERLRARPLAMRIAVILAAAALALGVLRLEVNSTYLTMINEAETVRQDHALLDAKMLPSSQLSILITAPEGAPLVTVHEALARLGAELRTIPALRATLDPLAIHSEVAPALELSADEAPEAYLFALTGGSRDVQRYLHETLTSFRAIVMFEYMNNAELRILIEDQIAPAIARAGLQAEVSGYAVLWSNLDGAIAKGQVIGLTLAALACAGLFLLVLRDRKLAFWGTLVNLMPVAMIAAVLGLSGVAIDLGAVFILSLLFGIAIDDTSFFLDAYQRNDSDLVGTLRDVAPPILLTSVLISVGFSVLLVSSFGPIQVFGVFTALGIIGAAFADILVLPYFLSTQKKDA